MNGNYIDLPYIEVHQPIGSFFVVSMKFEDVLSIAAADERIISDEPNKDKYMGIQRKISKSRTKEISAYCKTIDATFPTSIILAISSIDEDGQANGNINFANGRMQIKRSENIAKILDGQHRLQGLKLASNELETNFELNVTIFLNADIDAQAQIFSIINKAQTKVNKSLVYDLYDYSTYRCPQKTCHDVVCILNRNPNSPFYGKVKLLGVTDDSKAESISQATMAEQLMMLISKDPMGDRDVLRRPNIFGKVKLPKYEGSDEQKYVLRQYFVSDRDEEIVMLISNFFSCVAKKWPQAWNENRKDNVLNKSTGVIALMTFFRDVYLNSQKEQVDFEHLCFETFAKISIKDNSFTTENYLPGKKGQGLLLSHLRYFYSEQKRDSAESCRIDHTEIENILRDLPYDQGGTGRHKCAGCAYKLGYKDGLNKIKNADLDQRMQILDYSQAGAQRHKSAKEAYKIGLEKGLAESEL